MITEFTGVDRLNKPTILLVYGTRPEAIKMAPLAIALRKHSDEFDTVLCSTGQHREMLDQSLAAFGLQSDFDLELMAPQQTLATLTARALPAICDVISQVEPDMVVVQGDTTSALAGALAAYYHQVPVAHLEAGLRTDDLYQPFPEEGNRRLIGTLAELHFAPTSTAASALRDEGVPDSRILVTGNTGIDALLHLRDRLLKSGESTGKRGYRRILLTMHRRENLGVPFANICNAMLELVERNSDIEVVFPVHASPHVREIAHRVLGHHPRIALTKPLDYQKFVRALDSAHFVMTDSGGVQEEAPALGKPVLVLRDKTERPEGIVAGVSRLVGTDSRTLLREAETLLHDDGAYARMANAVNCYGDGRATSRVIDRFRTYFGLSQERPDEFNPSSDLHDRVRSIEVLEPLGV